VIHHHHHNQRTEIRTKCSDVEIISIKGVNLTSSRKSTPAIIYDKSDTGIGVFVISNKNYSTKMNLEVNGDEVYELRWLLKISRHVQYFGLKLVSV
jgi:hypothetical protein